jgi:hypothetical protein
MFYEIFILIRFSLELTLKLKFPKAFPVHNKVNNGLKVMIHFLSPVEC